MMLVRLAGRSLGQGSGAVQCRGEYASALASLPSGASGIDLSGFDWSRPVLGGERFFRPESVSALSGVGWTCADVGHGSLGWFTPGSTQN